MGLSGNDLMVYALIYGFSQKGQGCFYGGINYICETCGIARRTAMYILAELVEKGYIEKTELTHNGVKYVTYKASANNAQVVQKLHTGSAKIAPNNIDDIDINKRESNKRETFSKPSVQEVAEYCNERRNGIDAEEFVAFYESKGWMVGKSRMKDWKSAIITWEKSRQRKTSQPPVHKEKESVLAHNLKVMDEMFGTNSYEQAYGRKEVSIDEQ